MDFLTSSAYGAIIFLVLLNAWIVSRLDVEVRHHDD